LKNNEQFKKILRTMLRILLIFSETAVFAYIWLDHYNAFISVPFLGKGNWFFYLVYIIIFSLFLYAFDALKYGVYRKSNLITAQILATLATLFIVYLQIVLLSAEFVTVIPLLIGLVADVAVILLITIGGNWLLKKLFPPKKTLVIYDQYSPDTFIEKLKTRKDKFVIGDVVNISVGIEELEALIKESQSVIIYDIHSENRNKILKICFENNIRTYTTTKVSDILIRGAESLHLFDTPLLLYRNIGLTFEQRFLKRMLDIVVSAVGIIITLPFMLITALAIKLYDGGPIFYKQERLTHNGKKFFVYKFRSMIVNAESKSGAVLASKNDSRITPVGKFVRACRLDELPQFINVLKGDMSLVGPRPERPEIAEEYYKTLPEFGYRLKIKAGLTGYAQLYGKYNTTPYDKLQLDLIYIQNYSFLLDLRLILMTIKIMFMKESTEGMDNNKNKNNNKDEK